MERFKDFYNKFTIEESLDSRISEIASTGIFSYFGEDAIQRRFDKYKEDGVIPLQRLSKGGTQLNTTRSHEGRGEGGAVLIDVTEKEKEEMLPYIFKFLDKDVRDTLEEVYKDDEKKSNKLKKHYDGLTLRNVIEDASQIKGVLSNWLVVRHDKKSNVPKSLRQKLSFTKLQDKVDDAVSSVTGAKVSTDIKSGVDADIPEGFSFVKEEGDLRLYKWSNLGNVCSIDPKVKKNWMSIVVGLAGDVSENWCVASERYASYYGKPNGDGQFKYPYYLIRKKNGDEYTPLALMHGDSLQFKDRNDDSADEDLYNEVKSLVTPLIKTIVFGDE
mgnify:CR=1 FL=1